MLCQSGAQGRKFGVRRGVGPRAREEPEPRNLHSKFVAASRWCLPRRALHPPDFSPLRRNGTHGSGTRLVLEARQGPRRNFSCELSPWALIICRNPPESGGEGLDCSSTGIRQEFRRQLRRSVAESPFVLLGPPSLLFSLPLSVSGFCYPRRRRPSCSLSRTPGSRNSYHRGIPTESSREGSKQDGVAGPWPQDAGGTVPGPQSWELAGPRAMAAGAQRSWGASESPGAALLQRSL